MTDINYIKINGKKYPISGERGQAGVSPTIQVESILDGHNILGYELTITDATGTKSLSLMNGSDGEPYELTEDDKQDIVQRVLTETGKNDGAWTVTDHSDEWMARTFSISDGYLYAAADPWAIKDQYGDSVGVVAPDTPFSLDSLDISATYLVVCGVADAQAKLVFVPDSGYTLTEDDKQDIVQRVLAELAGQASN